MERSSTSYWSAARLGSPTWFTTAPLSPWVRRKPRTPSNSHSTPRRRAGVTPGTPSRAAVPRRTRPRPARHPEAGGRRSAEAPVSGSRRPAEEGQLVGMLAGPDEVVDQVRRLLAPVCASTVRCGQVPSAARMKLAVNLFLINHVAGLAEAFHFAECNGLDLETFRSVLDSGPMASAVSRMKLEKLVRGAFEPQASVSDVFYNSQLVADAARRAQVSSPLLDACHDLSGA